MYISENDNAKSTHIADKFSAFLGICNVCVRVCVLTSNVTRVYTVRTFVLKMEFFSLAKIWFSSFNILLLLSLSVHIIIKRITSCKIRTHIHKNFGRLIPRCFLDFWILVSDEQKWVRLYTLLAHTHNNKFGGEQRQPNVKKLKYVIFHWYAGLASNRSIVVLYPDR